MSDPVALRQAIYSHLHAMGGGVPIVWANTVGDADLPRFEVEAFGEDSTTLTLDFTERHTARIQVTAVVAEGTGESQFGPMVQALIAHFTRGLVIGGATITHTPRARQPFQSDGEYRVPVEIRYRAFR